MCIKIAFLGPDTPDCLIWSSSATFSPRAGGVCVCRGSFLIDMSIQIILYSIIEPTATVGGSGCGEYFL